MQAEPFPVLRSIGYDVLIWGIPIGMKLVQWLIVGFSSVDIFLCIHIEDTSVPHKTVCL